MSDRIKSRVVFYESPYVRILKKNVAGLEVSDPDSEYCCLEYPDFCNVIAVTADGQIVLVRQFRVGIERHTLEIPGGCLDEGESPEKGALRELFEETGYVPLPGARTESLGWSFPNPAIQGNRCYYFIAGPVAKQSQPTHTSQEFTEVYLSPISAIADSIRNSTLSHALVLNAFLFCRAKRPTPRFYSGAGIGAVSKARIIHMK